MLLTIFLSFPPFLLSSLAVLCSTCPLDPFWASIFNRLSSSSRLCLCARKGLGRWGWQVRVLYGRCSVKIGSAFSILFSPPLPKKKRKKERKNEWKTWDQKEKEKVYKSSSRPEIPTWAQFSWYIVCLHVSRALINAPLSGGLEPDYAPQYRTCKGHSITLPSSHTLFTGMQHLYSSASPWLYFSSSLERLLLLVQKCLSLFLENFLGLSLPRSPSAHCMLFIW